VKLSRVVVRFKDKRLLKGICSDFNPDGRYVVLRLVNGEKHKIDIDQLKAAFFVKKFSGNKDYVYRYQDVIPWGGNKIRVKFSDGEEMIGYTQHQDFNSGGFFLRPADLGGNNEKVYVVSSAAAEISFL